MLLLPQRSRNQASLSQQEENLPQLAELFVSRHICNTRSVAYNLFITYQSSWYNVLQNGVKYSPEHILLSQFSIKPYHFCLHCLQYRVPTLASISVHGNFWYSFSESIKISLCDFSDDEREFAFSVSILFLITSSTARVNFWVSSFDQGP